MRVAGDSHVGKVRTTNEDSLVLEPTRGLYAVLDGMGGANAGDVASQTARDAIREFVHVNRQLEPHQHTTQTNQAIFNRFAPPVTANAHKRKHRQLAGEPRR